MPIFSPRPHEPVEKIIQRANNGDVFFVTRSIANGDLADHPVNFVRRVLVIACELFTHREYQSRFPVTTEAQNLQSTIVEPHVDLAARAFLDQNSSPVELSQNHLKLERK